MKPTTTWQCCQSSCTRSLVIFFVQTLIGIGVLAFAFVAVDSGDCEKSAPYWGVIGTVIGFFFRKVSINPPASGTGGSTNRDTTPSTVT